MHEPAHLPRSAADLDDWSVYADHLLEIGDRRGELIAHDLALGAQPTPEEVAAFQARAKRSCPTHAEHVTPAWSLGFMRELHVRATRAYSMRPRFRVDRGALGNARAVLRTDAARLLETLGVAIEPGEHRDDTRRLCAALPPACATVALDVVAPIAAAQLAELIGWLPPHVRELHVTHREATLPPEIAGVLVTDRFDRVDVSRARHAPALHAALVDALGRTTRVCLRMATLPIASLAHARLELGAPGDAAVVVPGRHALALRRYRLIDLQRPGRVVGIRAQLGRTLREGYWIDLEHPTAGSGSSFMRHAGERWTAARPEQHSAADEPRPLAIDGASLAIGDIRPVPDGATIVVDSIAARFFATDAERRARELLATSS